MEQKVLPIKDSNVLHQVQRCLREDFKAGRRNYTIFQLGRATFSGSHGQMSSTTRKTRAAQRVSPRPQDGEN
nr:hypothetical protein [Pediococcus pentosaceus]